MATTADIRKGLCINWNNDTWKIVDFQHVKPGKGPAFVRTKLKSISTGKVLDNTFSAGHRIDEVRVETRKYQYLYEDDNGFHFMNNDDYSQVYLNKNMIENSQFMKSGDEVTIMFRAEDETPLSAEMAQFVILQITYTEPGLKGDTATNAMKPATTETGAEIRVPLFINEGDKVKINTEDGSYMERIKE
ncbi:MAG: elongation factor P [Weeksellaceae bacterium]|jgi:elongation factor P|nr:elongation factor P [Weeksellaceae bacterium]MDX9704721.1 elongation factor P [Weeksellaceae bacterium]